MERITFDNVNYKICDKPIYLNSGEFHYFRVPKHDWMERMQLFIEAGGNCIATYIPWIIHEENEGEFDFGKYDLEEFLILAKQLGLYVIARPGPYQYSELKYGGLPEWLIENYPEISATRLNGAPIRRDTVSYLHPTFIEKVDIWMSKVCRIISNHTIDNGGAIAFVQFDNELTGFHLWQGSCDYNSTTMGFGSNEGRYARFLSAKYANIDTLNKKYDSDYRSFGEVMPVDPTDAKSIFQLRCCKDYFDFYLSTISEYSMHLCKKMREYGITTPFVHNSGNPNMNAYFLETVKELGNEFLLGSDHYYNLGPHWEQNNPSPQYAIKVFYSNEMLRLMGFPPTVFELPGGSCSDWPPITPGDSMACYLVNLAFGMKGSNYYIFTGGANPPGIGQTTDLYDFNASIGADGEIRPLYYIQKQFGEFLCDNSWVVECEQIYDCEVALDFEYARSDQFIKGFRGMEFSNVGAWNFVLKGFLTTAKCSGYSPKFVDLGADRQYKNTDTPLVVVSSVSMARDKQQNLVKFLVNGGRLLIMPIIPTLDEEFSPCTILADFIGSPHIQKNTEFTTRVNICGINNIQKSDVFFSEPIPKGARLLGTDELTNKPISWHLALDKGDVLFLGLHWQHTMHEHEWLIKRLLGRLGVVQRVSCSNPNIWTSLRSNGKKSLLFVMNLFSSSMEACVKVLQDESLGWTELGTLIVPPMTVMVFSSDNNLDWKREF